MRRRLMAALVGLVAVVLVIAGVGSLLLTRDSARNQAVQQLVREAQSLTSQDSGLRSLSSLRVVRHVLSLEDALVVRVDVSGRVVTPLPAAVDPAELRPQRLLVGQTVSGQQGNLVFAAAPVPLSAGERVRLKLAGALAIVLTRQIGALGPSWTYYLIAGGAALAVAAVVAWQLSRRIARPLVEAVATTERIAAGDLQSRVPVRRDDYGELSSLARSINAMAQSLEDSRSRERDLLLSVSHDLRTPLTSIRGFAEAITDGAVEDTAQAAEVISAEARRLERLVGDLLDLTKLQASRLSVAMRPTDVALVAATTAEGFRPAAERQGVRLLVSAPGPGGALVGGVVAGGVVAGGVVAGGAVAGGAVAGGAVAGGAVAEVDPDRLAQLLANLVENALSFAATSVVLTVWPPSGDGYVYVTVDDDGPGIAAGDLDRVFERFHRADRRPRGQVGSGIGLAIVAELVSAMGGSVRAESPLTALGGTRFVVSLRQAALPTPPAATWAAEAPPPGTPAGLVGPIGVPAATEAGPTGLPAATEAGPTGAHGRP